MPKPANPKTTSTTAKPMANIGNALVSLLEARIHRQEMDCAVALVLKPAPTPAPTHTDDNNGSNVTTPRGKKWNDELENYLNNQ